MIFSIFSQGIFLILSAGLTAPAFGVIINDYYWRDYTGEIPFDAVSGGHDIHNQTTYIGQVYVNGRGVFPSTIYKDEKIVFAPILGPQKSTNFVQILCSQHADDFRWVQVNSTHFHLTAMDKHFVRCGWEGGNSLNIGRINYQGEMIVGKALGCNLENAVLYFVYQDKEIMVKSYEVLIFDEHFVDIDVRVSSS